MNQIYESLLCYNNIAISIYYAFKFSFKCIKLKMNFMPSMYKLNKIIVGIIDRYLVIKLNYDYQKIAKSYNFFCFAFI